MASPQFHLFNFLPCELRLEIWRAAIQPCGDVGGLHHFVITSNHMEYERRVESATALEDLSLMPDTYYLSAVPQIGGLHGDSSVAPALRSAYFWDAGLWTACKESRSVITKRYKGASKRERKLSHVDEHPPALVTVPQRNQSWCLIDQPSKDLFCLTPRSWAFDIDWQGIWGDLAITNPRQGGPREYLGSVQHLAIEFDPSWNLNWPADDSLKGENSPRGFVARLATSLFFANADCFLWLIDRSTPTPRVTSQTLPPQVFYDLVEDYVETEWDVIGRGCDGADMGNSATFIEKLERSLQTIRTGWEEEGVFFNIDYFVGILTCGGS